MSKRRAVSIEVREHGGGRVVVARFADGAVTQTAIDPNQTPRRKPRKPFARAKLARPAGAR